MYYFLIAFTALIALIIALMCVNISINMIFRTNPNNPDNPDDPDLKLFVRYAFLKFYIFPAKPEKEDERDKKKKVKPGKKETGIEKTVAKLKGNFESGEYKLSEMIESILEIAKFLVGSFQRYAKLKIKNFAIIIATDDAQKTALDYGLITQTTYYLYEFLNQHFNISQNNIKIYADFGSTKTSFDINMKFSIKLWHVLKTIFFMLIKYQNINNIN